MAARDPSPTAPATVPIALGWRFRGPALALVIPWSLLALVVGLGGWVLANDGHLVAAGVFAGLALWAACPATIRLRRAFAPRGSLTILRDELVVTHPAVLREEVRLRRDRVRVVALDDATGIGNRLPVRAAFRFSAPGEQEMLGYLYAKVDRGRRGSTFPMLGTDSQRPNLALVLKGPHTFAPRRDWQRFRSEKPSFGSLREPTIALLVEVADVALAGRVFDAWDVRRGLVESDFVVQPETSSPARDADPPAPPQLAGSIRSRTALAVAMSVGFYLLALTVAAVSLVGAFLALRTGNAQGSGFVLRGYLAAFGLGALGLVVLWSIFPRPAKFPGFGLTVTPGSQPRLWRLVRHVAESVGEPSPNEVRLVPDPNAFVYETGGPRSRRVLAIGLPLFAAMTENELTSLIGHELGHFKGGDTRLAHIAAATDRAIANTITRLESGFAHAIFVRYHKLFTRLAHGTMRREEFSADAVAAGVAGSAATASGLRRSYSSGTSFGWYWAEECVRALDAGARPPLVEGFQRFLSQPKVVARITEELERILREEVDTPYGTHPPLRARLAALDASPVGGRDESPTASGLLAAIDRLELELMVKVFGAEHIGGTRATPWDEIVERVDLARWREHVASIAAQLDGCTVGDLPAVAVDPARFAGRLGAADPRELAPEHATHGTVWTLGAALCVVLGDAGFRLTAEPGGPVVAVRGRARLQPFDAVEAMTRGRTDPTAWRRRCESEGLAGVALALPVETETAGEHAPAGTHA